ncbi:hypothetical protein BABINDRAFT_160719 [Babjeviella inositovora NRRL Y-12698]|uniref:FAS1 domain-containing protein n=1 Tax=Babjeviella inositovora NRRL Y-12698 TaxID=984486 RepID=A0A1E3QUM4_9ASCO|nr:uncharacterized protein BABINDRAFT_160719 [Babjeviella inositovora NRRL Y-12698]ODQ81370.1 hypothetical protein BABINDRAFT_160719 [Babjeviella inositovora NRRL Y-12698]
MRFPIPFLPLLLLTTVLSEVSTSDLVIDLPTTTLIDVLSRHAQFSTFLRLVQRNGLVLYLNSLSNVTLFAPVNSAFINTPEPFTLQNLTRYIVDDRITLEDAPWEGAILYTTKHVSATNPSLRTPAIIDYSDEERMLINGVAVVEPDLLANTSDNVVQGINALLHVPARLCELVTSEYNYTHSEVFKRLFASYSDGHCNLTNVTVFVPHDSSVNLTLVELSYLLLDHRGGKSKQSSVLLKSNVADEDLHSHIARDRSLVVQNFILPGYVGGNLDPFETANLNGDMVALRSFENGNRLSVNAVDTKFANIVTDDAIVHLLGKTNASQPGEYLDLRALVGFTPKKILIGMNCSNFVEDIIYRRLSHLIDDLSLEQTIIVAVDEEEDEISVQGTKSDLYQFVQGQVDFDELFADDDSTKLLDTKLYEPLKLGPGNCAKMKISQVGKGHKRDWVINNRFFVTSDKYTIGKTNIYLTDEEITPPPTDIVTAVAPYFHCSRSLSYFEELRLLHLPKNHKGYTIFLPCYQSWKSLDLTYKYLESNKTALRLVLENMILESLVYDEETDVQVSTLGGESMVVKSAGSDLLLNDTLVRMDRGTTDIMYLQGVIHLIEEIIIPDSLTIDIKDLINHNTNDDGYFLDLLRAYGLAHYLTPEYNYSMLLPTTKSLKFNSVNGSYPDIEKLLKLHLLPPGAIDLLLQCGQTQALQRHHNITSEEFKIPTLLNNTFLGCREVSSKHFMLHISEGDVSHEVRILNTGCTNPSSRFNSKTNQCLYIIDRPLLPSWLLQHPIKVILHLPWTAIGLGIILGAFGIVCMFSIFMVVFVGMRKQGSVASLPSSPEPDIEADVENSETLPFLGNATAGYGSTEAPRSLRTSPKGSPPKNKAKNKLKAPNVKVTPPLSEALYSDNSTAQPIKVTLSIISTLNRERHLPG